MLVEVREHRVIFTDSFLEMLKLIGDTAFFLSDHAVGAPHGLNELGKCRGNISFTVESHAVLLRPFMIFAVEQGLVLAVEEKFLQVVVAHEAPEGCVHVASVSEVREAQPATALFTGEIFQFHEILLHKLERAVIYVLRFFHGHPVDVDGTTLHVVVRVIALLFFVVY